MATTRKPKKPLNISIDTKHVDIEFHRDAEGNVNASLDTPIIDVDVTKTDKGVNVKVDLDNDKEYEFESNGKEHHLPKGTVWKITGELAKIFLKRGLGKLK
jgi:hypothetical protein